MQIAFVIYDGMTALDFIGVYKPVTRLRRWEFAPDLRWEICSYSKEVRDPPRAAFRDLERFCARVVDQRIVDEGEVITAKGVTSAIDLGLYLCEKLAGREARERIRQQMDYVVHDA